MPTLTEFVRNIFGLKNSSVTPPINLVANPPLTSEGNKDEKIKEELGLLRSEDVLVDLPQEEFRKDQLEIVEKLTDLIVKRNFALVDESKVEERKTIEDELVELVEKVDRERKPEVAIKIFSKVLESGPNPYIYNGRSKANARCGKHKEALDDFELAAESGFQYTNADCQRVEEARIAMRDRGTLEAEPLLKQLNHLITLIPNSSILHSARGHTNWMLGKHDEVLVDFDRALAINPQETWRNYEKGDFLAASGRYEESLECFKKEKDLQSPQNPNRNFYVWRVALKSMGYVYMELKRDAEVIKIFEELRDASVDSKEIEFAQRMVEQAKSGQKDRELIKMRPHNKYHIKRRDFLLSSRRQIASAINVEHFLPEELEREFFRRAEIDEDLIENALRMGVEEDIQNFSERADTEFSQLEISETARQHCRKIIGDSYHKNAVLKARRWCKRSEFLEPQNVQDALGDLREIKERLTAGGDLTKEDEAKVESSYTTLFYSGNSGRFEQSIHEITQLHDKKHGAYFNYWLTRANYDLQRYEAAEKIAQDTMKSLEEKSKLPENFSSIHEDLAKKLAGVNGDIEFEKMPASEKWKRSAEAYLLIFVAVPCCFAAMIAVVAALDQPRSVPDKEIFESIVKNAISDSMLEFDKSTLPQVCDQMSEKLMTILTDKNRHSDKKTLEDKITSALLEVMAENVEAIDLEGGKAKITIPQITDKILQATHKNIEDPSRILKSVHAKSMGGWMDPNAKKTI